MRYCLRLSIIIFFIQWMGISFANATAIPVLTITEAEDYGLIGNHVVTMEDPQRKYTIADVIKKYDSLPFQQSTSSVMNWGFVNSSFWIGFRLNNSTNQPRSLFLEIDFALLHEVAFYELKGDTAPTVSMAGSNYPFNIRANPHRNPLFHISLAPQQTKTFYCRINSDGKTVAVPMKLRNEHSQAIHDKDAYGLQGLFYGIVLIIALINLFFYITVKDVAYWYYILYVISFGLTQMTYDGLAHQYLWPSLPFLQTIGVPLFGLFATLAVVQFTRVFFEVKATMPRMNRFWLFYCLPLLPLGIMLLFPNPFFITGVIGINLLAFLLFLPVVGTGIYAYRQQHKGALLFTLAFLSLFFGLITFTLTNLSVLKEGFLAAYGMKIGSGVEMITLSFSLGVRFKAMKDEKEQAQAQQFKQLEELQKVTSEMNVELEKKVKERTKELAEKNKDITDSINYARRIQQAILPPLEEIHKNFSDSFVLFCPKDIVSGDFYWFAEKGTVKLIAAADCTGHGVPGAMVSVVCANALNRAVNELGLTEPGKILDKVRELVLETFEKSEGQVRDGMDISLCAFNSNTLELKWAGANNPLWYIQNHDFKIITADKQPIGKTESSTSFTTHTAQLIKGDIVYLFSDGFADQFGGEKRKKLMYKPFREYLFSIREFSMTEQREQLYKKFNAWKGELEQIDDVLVIGFKA